MKKVDRRIPFHEDFAKNQYGIIKIAKEMEEKV